jgi:hypothetical protein
MNLQANLKLALSKQRYKITIAYNTFEKARYDQYLCASLALRAETRYQALEYINEITGDGSLNAHFSKLYYEAKELSQQALETVLESSMYPILKIDASNSYDYYPELDISVYRQRVFKGNLNTLSAEKIATIVGIREPLVKCEFAEGKLEKKVEPYVTKLTDEGVLVSIQKEWNPISEQVFSLVLVTENLPINRYEGQILRSPDGEGWSILTASTFNNLCNDRAHYYDSGKYYRIRDYDVQEITVAFVAGLYLYRQGTVPFKGNSALCERVLAQLFKSDELKLRKPQVVIELLKQVSDTSKQVALNYLIVYNKDKQYVDYGLSLLREGLREGWTNDDLEAFLKHAGVKELEIIYRCNSNLKYSLEQLLKLPRPLLASKHLEMVRKYEEDLEKRREVVRKIIGEVTTSGLRERSKELVSDTETKRFSKLCNKLIGHVDADLAKISEKELTAWEQDALELQELAKVIERKIAEQK